MKEVGPRLGHTLNHSTLKHYPPTLGPQKHYFARIRSQGHFLGIDLLKHAISSEIILG